MNYLPSSSTKSSRALSFTILAYSLSSTSSYTFLTSSTSYLCLPPAAFTFLSFSSAANRPCLSILRRLLRCSEPAEDAFSLKWISPWNSCYQLTWWVTHVGQYPLITSKLKTTWILQEISRNYLKISTESGLRLQSVCFRWHLFCFRAKHRSLVAHEIASKCSENRGSKSSRAAIFTRMIFGSGIILAWKTGNLRCFDFLWDFDFYPMKQLPRNNNAKITSAILLYGGNYIDYNRTRKNRIMNPNKF